MSVGQELTRPEDESSKNKEVYRWMCVHTRIDRIKNEDIRNKVGMASAVDKMREVRLR